MAGEVLWQGRNPCEATVHLLLKPLKFFIHKIWPFLKQFCQLWPWPSSENLCVSYNDLFDDLTPSIHWSLSKADPMTLSRRSASDWHHWARMEISWTQKHVLMPTLLRDTLILHPLGLLRMKQRLLNDQILICNVCPVEAMIIDHEGTLRPTRIKDLEIWSSMEVGTQESPDHLWYLIACLD